MDKTTAIYKSLNTKTGGKARLVLFASVFILLLLVLSAVYLISRDNVNCQVLISQTNKQLDKGVSIKQMNNIDTELTDHAKTCTSSHKKLLVISNDSSQSSVERIQYYHVKAVIEYSIGQNVRAKQDATSGLSIASGLPASPQGNSSDFSRIIKELNSIKNGTY